MEEEPIGQPRPIKHPFIRKALSIFLAGLATVIPVVGTVWLIYLIFKVLLVVGEKIIVAVLRMLNFLRGTEGETDPWVFVFPGDEFAWFFIPVTLLFLMGFAVMNRPGRAVVNWVDGAITRIPILGFIYATLKQFMDALRNLGGPRKFKGVAYVEYPSPGCRLLGFITGNYHDPERGKDVTSVFLPTSPNPMTGFIVVVDDEKLIECHMTLEEASKMILSAGLVSPASFEGK
ncbi:MAG: DUF502 domain-containing protein [Akkermansiaceae bacterium]|nr:DUF502 domain-containing protein [Akkermansiaceae bacterium]